MPLERTYLQASNDLHFTALVLARRSRIHINDAHETLRSESLGSITLYKNRAWGWLETSSLDDRTTELEYAPNNLFYFTTTGEGENDYHSRLARHLPLA